VQFLLNNQPFYANIHERADEYHTAIQSAAEPWAMTRYEPIYSQDWVDKKEAIMNLLLDWGACASDSDSPVAEEKTGATVLTLAVKWAGPGLIKRLIRGGADIHARVRNCQHNLRFHSQYGYIDEVTAIFIACVYGNFNPIEILLDYRGHEIYAADMILSRDSRGSLPLRWAALNRSQFQISPQDRVQNATRVIDFLLDIDPMIINVQDNEGNTPLHYAARNFGQRNKQYTTILKLLCKRGAGASIRNNKSETPLHTFFFRSSNYKPNDIDAIATLLAYGAKVIDADDNGNTPLHLVASNLN
jgi:ankyrin repeat protein